MKNKHSLSCNLTVFLALLLAAFSAVGCRSTSKAPTATAVQAPATPTPAPAAPAEAPAPPAAPAAVSTPSPTSPAMAPAVAQMVLPMRIRAGSGEGFTDSQGNHWLPEQGFADGDSVERPDLTITNTSDPEIYHAEHYGMTRFTQPLPNGKYLVKLHFCETYEGIGGPGQRVFSFNVAGKQFDNFDVWVKAGGSQRAYVESVPVEITDGKLVITFTANVENPQINGIEILSAE